MVEPRYRCPRCGSHQVFVAREWWFHGGPPDPQLDAIDERGECSDCRFARPIGEFEQMPPCVCPKCGSRAVFVGRDLWPYEEPPVPEVGTIEDIAECCDCDFAGSTREAARAARRGALFRLRRALLWRLRCALHYRLNRLRRALRGD